MEELSKVQESLLIIINTPAHNPTGYSLSAKDWDEITGVVEAAGENCRITLFVDVAYIDYAGDEEEVRFFVEKLVINVNLDGLKGVTVKKLL